MRKLGLDGNVVELLEYQESWKEEANIIIKKLKTILKDTAKDIQHIGSTSIIGMKAKPIIDIAIGLDNLDDIMKYVPELEKNEIYYREKPQTDDWQRFFRCGDLENDIKTHHIHAVKYKGEAWNNYINFRDALNNNESLRKKYMHAKIALKEKYPRDRKKYVEEKGKFVQEILQQINNKEQNLEIEK